MALGKPLLADQPEGGLLRGSGLVLCMYQMFLVHPNVFLETKNLGQTHETSEGQRVVAAEFPVRKCDPGCPERLKIHRNFSFRFHGQTSWTLWL